MLLEGSTDKNNLSYRDLTLEEFCDIIVKRYKYRKMDYMFEPSIYPTGKYEELLRKYGDKLDYISSYNLLDKVE